MLLHALAASLFTSVVPALLLFLVPNGVAPRVLRIFLAFAAGGLLGDVFLHMLPGMITTGSGDHHHHHHDHDHDHSHDHGDHHHAHADPAPLLLMLAGIAIFYFIEGLFKSHHHHGHGHSHGAESHGQPKGKGSDSNDSAVVKRTASSLTTARNRTKKGSMDTSSVDESGKMSATKEDEDDEVEGHRQATAWLSLLADTTHNITDGFVIGISFLTGGINAGYRTTLLVLIHEIPHELGDFAVLKTCGWSVGQIVKFQLVTALGNFAGTISVLTIGSWVQSAKAVIGPLAAGSFIYVALVSILADINSVHGVGLRERFLHVVAFSLGVLALHQVAWFEELLGVHAH